MQIKISKKRWVYCLGAIIATVGIIVLVGWQIDSSALKAFGFGGVTMKANTAALFLLAGFALIILQNPKPAFNHIVSFLSMVIMAVGFLSLCQNFFGLDFGLDELLYREAGQTIGTFHPGLMAPNTALNFLLLGLALFLMPLNRIWTNYLVVFSCIFPLIISVIGLMGYIFGLDELTGPASYTRMAANTAIAFLFLSMGQLMTLFHWPRSPISLEQKLLVGLTTSFTVILFISFLSISGIQSLQQTSKLVEHTRIVKNQVEKIFNQVLEIQSGDRGFITTGDESYLAMHDKAIKVVPEIIDNARILMADNPAQQKNLKTLERLVLDRLVFSLKRIETRKSDGEATSLLLYPLDKGKEITDSIRLYSEYMRAEEDRLLQIRNEQEAYSAKRNRLIISLSLMIQLLLLAIIFTIVRRNVQSRRNAEVTLQKLNEELEYRIQERTAKVVQSEKRYRDMIETSLIGVYSTTVDGKILFVNDAIIQLMEAGSAEEITSSPVQIVYKNPETRTRLLRQLDQYGMVTDFESEMITTKGNVITVLLSAKLQDNILTGMILEITERKKAEEEIRKANRIYAVLSNINQTIVRVTDRQTLYNEACRIAVDDGKFHMTWIGMVDELTNKFVPVAAAGLAKEYIKLINIDLNDPVLGDGPIGRCIKSGLHYLANDIDNNPEMIPMFVNVSQLDYKSSAAFPITVFGKTIGAFLIYSDEKHFFDETEVKLLDELAKDVSFAIEGIETKIKSQQGESARRESEEKFFHVFHTMPDPIVLLSLKDGSINEVNKAFIDTTGYLYEEMVGYKILDFKLWVNPDDLGKITSSLKEEGKLSNFETSLNKKSGEKVDCLLSASMVHIQDEQNILFTVHDITERKNAERNLIIANKELAYQNEEKEKRALELSISNKELEKSKSEIIKLNNGLEQKVVARTVALIENEERFRNLANNISQLAWMADEQGSIFWYNQRWFDYTGTTIDEMGGWGWQKVHHPDYVQVVVDKIKHCFETGEVWEDTFPLRGSDGLFRWFLSRAVPIRNEQGAVLRWFGTNTDITESRQAQEEIKKARTEADRANLAKSEFLSRMSHELRTPMNSILGFAQLMDMGELTPAHKKSVDHILKSGKHLLDLINEVLDLSKIEAGELSISLEPVQLQGIVSETMDVIRPLATAKNITFEFPASPVCDLFVKADRQKIKQVLLNLLSNAVKYNRKGGSVKIACEVRRPETTDLQIQTVRINVTDTGMGISPEYMDRLFNPFERIGAEVSEVEGTGLGLTVSKKLIEAMGGTIGVESLSGVGSKFWIELLQTEGQISRHGRKGGFTKPESESVVRGTLLYIEDNVSNIQLIEQILEMHRPNIHLISEMYGKRALKIADEYNADLILLDLDLPDIHGSEVLKLLQATEATKSIPVVILSADAMTNQIEKLLRSGARDYLTKPLDVGKFLKVIDALIVRG